MPRSRPGAGARPRAASAGGLRGARRNHAPAPRGARSLRDASEPLKGPLEAVEIHGACSAFQTDASPGVCWAQPAARQGLAHHVRRPRCRRPGTTVPRGSPRASAGGEGRYLRPGWLLPARIRRTRSGRPSRQLRAVDTRKI